MGDLHFMCYMRKIVYCIVLSAYFASYAGSFEDFFTAVKRDDAELVQSLLARQFDGNAVNAAGQSGLFLALKEPSPKVTAVLLAWPGIRIESRSADDESPLMMAALRGDLAQVKVLVARGADVNKPGWTPLHYAATGGHAAVIGLLLDENAYIDAASPNGSTPLMMAARYGNDESVRTLLLAGADPKLRNQLGLSAQDFAQMGDRPGAVALLAKAAGPATPASAPRKVPSW